MTATDREKERRVDSMSELTKEAHDNILEPQSKCLLLLADRPANTQ